MNLKDIHIGSLIEQKVKENGVDMSRITKFLKVNENIVFDMYRQKSLDTEILLRWSKLLEYDFFRFYSQHLILYAPTKKVNTTHPSETSSLPTFRKNIYTIEIVEFILEKLNSGKMTKQQIMDEYNIPKTTLYKWISKYNQSVR